jgi:hypothetical protein
MEGSTDLYYAKKVADTLGTEHHEVLFTPEEARLAIHLSMIPEALDRIHKRVRSSGISVEELKKALERMASKGAISSTKKDGDKLYSLMPLVVGMFETQVDRLTADFAKDMRTYFLAKNLLSSIGYLVFIHKKMHRIGNYVFIGYGGGGFDDLEPDFERFIEKSMAKLKSDDKVVLMTHGPPYGTKLDIIGKGHHGCKSYTKYIKILKPILYICGHFHETFGAKDRIGKTPMINPGPKGVLVEL